MGTGSPRAPGRGANRAGQRGETPGQKQARDFTKDKIADLEKSLAERANEALERARERMNQPNPDPQKEIRLFSQVSG